MDDGMRKGTGGAATGKVTVTGGVAATVKMDVRAGANMEENGCLPSIVGEGEREKDVCVPNLELTLMPDKHKSSLSANLTPSLIHNLGLGLTLRRRVKKKKPPTKPPTLAPAACS